MYHDIVAKLVSDWWNDPNYSHGFLIPIISGYLVWSKRTKLQQSQATPSPWGMPLLLLGGLLFLLGQIAGEQFTQRLSLIIVIAGLVLMVAGKGWFKILGFPLAYLVFMIPLPYIVYDSVAFPLKLLATKISTIILHLLGSTVYTEGNIIFLPNTTLEVADACSGIRSLISILALSVVMAFFTQRTTFSRILLVGLSIPVVLFCNILRIVITGILAAKNPALATGFFHSFSGEAIFLLGIVLILIFSFFIKKLDRNPLAPVLTSPSLPDTGKKPQRALLIWTAPVILALLSVFSVYLSQVEAVPLNRPLTTFPGKIGEFHKVKDDILDEKVLSILGVDNYLFRAYTGPGNYHLWLYIGYFQDQKEGEMIHSPKHCYPGAGWNPVESTTVQLSIPGMEKKIVVNELVVQKGRERQLVYYWYQSRGKTIASEYRDRIYMVIDSLLRGRSDGALIRISGPADDIEQARRTQRAFIRKLYPTLQDYIPS